MVKYRELAHTIKIKILKGVYEPGSRLPSIRELSHQYGCNPNTMYQSLRLLKEEGIITSEKTVGYYVIKNIKKINSIKQEEFLDFFKGMQDTLIKMGYSKEELLLSISEDKKSQ